MEARSVAVVAPVLARGEPPHCPETPAWPFFRQTRPFRARQAKVDPGFAARRATTGKSRAFSTAIVGPPEPKRL
jgi:hypothetical protein